MIDLNLLNPQQREAAETMEGPVLILAGAGSGKTRALTFHIANLIDHGVEPWHILAITFTNKAAREMKDRVAKLVGEGGQEVWVSTFHSMCARILRRDIEKLGYTRNFTIYDDDDQTSMIKDVYKRLSIDDKLFPQRETKALISDAKSRVLPPDEWFEQSAKDHRAQIHHDIYVAYENHLKKNNALDFDDLLLRTLELFAEHPPVLEYYRDRFRYVHVDEYQDTNFAQYSLVRVLTAKHGNLCVVGDDDQSIYGWRGADIRNILNFQKDYPNARVIKLEQNYRSTANILDAANQVIAHNDARMEKSLWTEAGEGAPIHVYCAADEREEGAWICDRMLQLVNSGRKYGDMAILYRSNAQSRILEEMLTRTGIKYRVYGGLRFYDRKEIKDIIAYLRCMVNPSDDVSLRRIINQPKRAIGDSTVAELTRCAAQEDVPLYAMLTDVPQTLSARPRKCVADFGLMMNDLIFSRDEMDLPAFVEHVVDVTGLRKQYENDLSDEGIARLENIDEFLGAVTDYCKNTENPTLEDYLETVSLQSDMDDSELNEKIVTLMTLHSAKGLEFPVVFIAGMEEGIFPSGRSAQTEERLQEERRLCYVGITRAREDLFLSHASQRSIYNQVNYNAPSRFLKEIPERLLDDRWHNKRERSFGVSEPRVVTPRGISRRSEGILGRNQSALGIPGVQKGFTPSLARSVVIPPKTNQFQPGDRVMHKKFGEGNVVRVTGIGKDARITISFAAYGEKEFMMAYVPLVKVNE